MLNCRKAYVKVLQVASRGDLSKHSSVNPWMGNSQWVPSKCSEKCLPRGQGQCCLGTVSTKSRIGEREDNNSSHWKWKYYLLSRVRLSETPWTAARQASLSFTISQSLLKLMSIELVMPSNHLILCRPLLLPPSSFPGSGSFPMSRLFAAGGQSIGASASASVLAMNIQDYFL